MLPSTRRSPLRILFVDDHTVFRQALVRLVEARPEVAAIATCSTGADGIAKAQSWRPDIVLMDVVMPGLNGIDATAEIRRLSDPPRVLILAGYGDENVVVEALRAGASGYVLKDCDAEELLMAIAIVHQGGVYVSARLCEGSDVAELIERAHHAAPSSLETLTPRELEILRLIADGYTGRGIANLLHLSPKTVERHRERLMTKLGLHNKVQLTRFAVRHGLALEGDGENGGRIIA